MQRVRVLVLALLLATVLAPPRVAAAASPPRVGSPGVPVAAGKLWEPWLPLREWLGGLRIDCGGSVDPLGRCAAGAPGASQPAARGRQPRPPSRPVGGRSRFRIECGGSIDPYGRCMSAALGTGQPEREV
jgi:hypothetical protein